MKIDPLCSAIFAAFGVDLTCWDTSLPGHLKNGHAKIPSDIIEAVRACDPESVVHGFESTVMGLIKDSMRPPLLLAIQTILKEDQTIDSDCQISWLREYTKEAVLYTYSIDFTYFLTSLIRFSILEIDNQECKNGIKEIELTPNC